MRSSYPSLKDFGFRISDFEFSTRTPREPGRVDGIPNSEFKIPNSAIQPRPQSRLDCCQVSQKSIASSRCVSAARN